MNTNRNAIQPSSSDLDLAAYMAIVRECDWISAQADLAAALRAPKAPAGDNVTSTVRPMRAR